MLEIVIKWIKSFAYTKSARAVKKIFWYPARSAWYQYITKRAAKHGKNVVLVYQMGKVASRSIVQSLRDRPGICTFHVHYISPENMERQRSVFESVMHESDVSYLYDAGNAVYRNLIRSGRSIKLITLIREPISRNISAYFQNLDFWNATRSYHEKVELSILIDRFKKTFPHAEPLNWFDDEFKSATGIDVYQYEFSRENGHLRIQQGRFDLLLMRHDLPDHLKAELIGELLGLRDFSISRENTAEKKSYYDKYNAFRRSVRLEESYVSEMLNSKYTRHFFPENEIEAIRKS